MQKLVLFSICLFAIFITKAQTQNPVAWQAIYKAISTNEGEIIITAKIEKGWHTYSQRPSDAGPISTTFSFTPSKHYELVGKTDESNAHEEFDKAFDAKIFMFTDKAEFKQKIKIKSKSGFSVPFTVEYICCNEMSCLPPKIIALKVTVQ